MLVITAFIALIVGVMWFLGAWLGPKNRTPVKQDPFECGVVPFQTPGDRFGVKFYLIAILFVIFDIDLAFLFPWAAVFRDVGAVALYSMVLFIGILSVALWYVWKKGAFRWE
ncbi:MAG: NADH-quinone oxidoreductase subunit A [Candidatus Zixiibacteriota bacterium]